MSTSPYQAPSWDDENYVLLGVESLEPPPDAVGNPFVDQVNSLVEAVDAADSLTDASDTVRVRSTEYATLPGLPGRGVIVVTTLVTACAAGLDFALTSGLSIFFDLCFVVIALVGAMAVRRYDLFTTGVLTPLMFAVTIATISIAAPETFTASDGFPKAVMSGLAGHAGALVAAYAVALVVVFGRAAATRR
ncbi:MAG: hypothetical protein H0T17_04985 [Propionibacteriales bacterium]|nr:hypothetical protein [Propionibacteriales bacterium]